MIYSLIYGVTVREGEIKVKEGKKSIIISKIPKN